MLSSVPGCLNTRIPGAEEQLKVITGDQLPRSILLVLSSDKPREESLSKSVISDSRDGGFLLAEPAGVEGVHTPGTEELVLAFIQPDVSEIWLEIIRENLT